MALFGRKDKEREEQEAAAKKAEREREAKEAAKQMQENLERRKTEAEAKKKEEEAKKQADAQVKREEQRRVMADRQKEALEKKKADAVLDTYTVKAGDTLSDIALKYYKSAARDKWMAIYEANKAVIGDDHNVIKPGQELKIPKLD
jgi:colicin import membrane protein